MRARYSSVIRVFSGVSTKARPHTLQRQFALAYAWLGRTYEREWDWLWSRDPQTLEQAFRFAQKALALDESLPFAHSLLGGLYSRKGQTEHAIAEGEEAIRLDPNDAEAYVSLGKILAFAGRPEEAIGVVEKAMRLDPQSAAYSSLALGIACRLMGRYEEAMAAQRRALTRNPDFLPAHAELVMLYRELGREKEARAEEAEVLRLNPTYSLEIHKQRMPMKDPAVLERYVAVLRQAGLK
jgi:tetratricopeptide (TPR) repeat protein